MIKAFIYWVTAWILFVVCWPVLFVRAWGQTKPVHRGPGIYSGRSTRIGPTRIGCLIPS